MTTPRIRAADTDRQQAADRLAEHYTAGRLSTQEYDERVASAYAITFLDERSALFDDLPGADRGRSADGGSLFGADGFGSGFGSGVDPARFGSAFGPAFAKATAASRRGGEGDRSGRRGRLGPFGGVPPVLAVALMALLGFTAVVVIAHVIVPLFVIGIIVLLVGRGRRGGPRNRHGGPGGRGGWNGHRQRWAA